MEQNNQKRSSRRKHTFSLAEWTFIVSCSVYVSAVHHERMMGFSGLLMILIILVGIMHIFKEITELLQEPQ
jgi:uncharacterized membrane protein